MGALPVTWTLVPARVVVNVCGVYPHGDPNGRRIHDLPMLDLLDRSMMLPRDNLERFLAAVHQDARNEASYWHCHAGLNRSGFVIAAYLHLYRGLRISDAINRLRGLRAPTVLCNHLFEGTLRRWYGEPDEQEFSRMALTDYLRERQGR